MPPTCTASCRKPPSGSDTESKGRRNESPRDNQRLRSVRDLGIGPSSSHTIGPMVAA
ncbi:serine dehydratase beta chain [Methylobacterium pseudosasicola]|uniref:serine dehydratase beta chain n=1 Tax=Methylobacterium pseudosasicola TaxID=582667 RepID=UPI003CC79D8D